MAPGLAMRSSLSQASLLSLEFAAWIPSPLGSQHAATVRNVTPCWAADPTQYPKNDTVTPGRNLAERCPQALAIGGCGRIPAWGVHRAMESVRSNGVLGVRTICTPVKGCPQ